VKPLLCIIPFVLGCGLLAGCGTAANAGKTQPLTAVTVGMGYIPNVQFAPFYVAQTKGYYRRAGLNVRFNYAIEPDLLTLANEGKLDFVNAGGDEVVAADAHGLHVRYVMTEYSRFPSALFALRSSGIRTINDLKGRTIGVPGTYGASYVGLLALLHHAGLSRSSVSIESINYTQVPAVANHKVDAAEGYAMNEPIELRAEGKQVTEFDVWRWANLAGAGISAGDRFISAHPSIVRAFVRATLQGLAYTLAHPRAAFTISARAVPITSGQTVQWHVLQRAIDFWRPETGKPLGYVDPAVWSLTDRLLARYGETPHTVPVSSLYSNAYIR